MSTLSLVTSWNNTERPVTVRNFACSVGLAALATAAGCVIYLVEKLGWPDVSRFAQNPVEITVRCLGLAHFIVGWLFLATSPRLRQRQALRRLLLCLLAGTALCITFARLGSLRNPLLYVLFYGAFLFHEVRDEAIIYQCYAKVRPSGLLGAFSFMTAIFFVTLLVLGYVVFRYAADRGVLLELWLLAGILLAVCAWSLHRFRRLLGRGNVERFIAEHRPLVVVYAALLVILMLSAPLGSIGFVVLLHVASWLVFVHAQLRNKPAPARFHVWTWLRSTPAGFLTLHLGLAMILLVLMALRVHVWQRVGLLSDVFASASFSYWALLHICTSFWDAK